MTPREAWAIIKEADLNDCGPPGEEFASPKLEEAIKFMDGFIPQCESAEGMLSLVKKY